MQALLWRRVSFASRTICSIPNRASTTLRAPALLNMAARPSSARKRERPWSSAAGAGDTTTVLDASSFAMMVDTYTLLDEMRERVIKRSRDVQKLAKQSIYSSLRADNDKAGKQIEQAMSAATELLPIINDAAKHTGGMPFLRMGSYSNALEELAEGMILAHFIKHGKVASPKELNELFAINANKDKVAAVELTSEEYLGGLLDFTGELQRYSIARATDRDVEAVALCRDACDQIFGQMLNFDLRNGGLRKKFDSLKYTLKKMEATMYELSLSGSAAGLATAAHAKEGGGGGEEADGNE